MSITIKKNAQDNTCTGCGTCVAMCPNRAINLVIDNKKGIYLPRVIERECAQCGICSSVCPSMTPIEMPFDLRLSKQHSKNADIGIYIRNYIGYASDFSIRYNSSSGGLVTQLLLFALDEGIIDGAVVTRMKKDNPVDPEPFIARTKEEIIEASKSKYCPVPLNSTLSAILKSNPDERFAVVALPCHLLGIRNAETLNNELRKKIVLHFGLFCAHNTSFLGRNFVLSKLGIEPQNIKKIDYRGEGWPGKFKITLLDGRSITDNKKYAGVLIFKPRFFTPMYCMSCTDALSELADISFGDPWLPEYKDERIGKSLIISRTVKGESLLQQAIAKGKIELDAVSLNKVLNAAAHPLHYKKKVSRALFYLYKPFKKNPNKASMGGSFGVSRLSIGDYLSAIVLYSSAWLSSKHFFWGIVSVATEIEWYIGKKLKKL